MSQARILEWVAISSSRGSSQTRDQTHVSCIGRWIFLPLSHLGCLYYTCVCQLLSHAQLFAIPWPVSHQALLSIELSRQEYWSELLFPSPGDLPDPGFEPWSPTLASRFFTIWAIREASIIHMSTYNFCSKTNLFHNLFFSPINLSF